MADARLSRDETPSSEVLSEEQTIQFLLRCGFKRLETLVVGQPVLCVIPQSVRTGGENDACVARFDNPRFFNSLRIGNADSEGGGGAECEYFAIGSNGVPRRITTGLLTSFLAIEKNRVFQIGTSSLFSRGHG